MHKFVLEKQLLPSDSLDIRTHRVEGSDDIKLGWSIVDGYRKITVDLEGSIIGNICDNMYGLLHDHYGSNDTPHITLVGSCAESDNAA